ncbi:MAG: TetR/AcrR family transcriptional regulator [Candidatus Andeanibacterium colombiense]|uniref:TetR/AcrR family transcriptional regulator n=1 Tax=Candidatus Andeanibacterium colombiense TaxID=3121345 RepID=A0AAJ6BPG0_9SPHN|nr:MAG: TetR/AcrR family transcriptional regulator [Sphingomonadaceae bacterium]
MAKLNVDLARRAEIAAKRRSNTRARLLDAARSLFGREGGRVTRVEDICEAAGIARGTFYNYFPSFDTLQAALFEELSNRFDLAVHLAFEQMEGPAERTCAAIRFYLTHVVEDREWGWGMVNTGMGIGFFPVSVSERVAETIQEGIDAGDFTISNAIAGRDILLGAGLAAATTLLNSKAAPDHIASVASGVLQALGLPAVRARQLASEVIPELPYREGPTDDARQPGVAPL